jgi:DNA sulfur modification protein DndC
MIQKQVGSRGTNEQGTVISKDELEQVRSIWRFEEADWEDSVPRIYREVFGSDLEWASSELPAFSADEKGTLERICGRHDIAPEMIAKLLELERSFHGMSRRSSIQHRIGSILDEDWRTEDEIQMQLESIADNQLVQISIGADFSDS